MKKDDLVFVYYINVNGMTGEEAFMFSRNLQDYLKDNDMQGEGIKNVILPVYNTDTRVECINPLLLPEDEYRVVKEKVERYEKMLDEFLTPNILPGCDNVDLVNPETGEINLPYEPIKFEQDYWIPCQGWLSRLIQKFSNLAVPVKPENVCYFCEKDNTEEELVFDSEFDTFVHKSCIRKEIEKGNEEAILMDYLIKDL